MASGAAASAEVPVTRREQLLDAAVLCFEQWGVRRATVDDIAARAGVTRQTVYNYFSGRDEIITEVILREASRISVEVHAALDLSAPAAELLVDAQVQWLRAVRASEYLDLLVGRGGLEVTADVCDRSAQIPVVQAEFWSPVLAVLSDRGELREGLDADDLVDWLTWLHFALVLRPTLAGDEGRVRLLLEEFVLPAVLSGQAPTTRSSRAARPARRRRDT